MRDYEEFNKLVVAKLKKFGQRGESPTAKELFREVALTKPILARRGFKSFIKIINFLPDIESVTICKGQARVYKVK